MPAKYQIFKDIAGKYRFRLRAENNKIVAVGEAYERKAGAMNGVKSVQANCQSKIEDKTIGGEVLVNPKYQVFCDDAGKFRFNLSASNGEIIAASEDYESKQGVMNGISAVQKSCDAEIEDMTLSQPEPESSYERVMAAPVEAKGTVMSGDRYHKILAMLVLVQIIASFASIVIWYAQPDMRMTLVVPYIDASIVAAVVGVVAIVAFLGIRMHTKWAPILVIILTISNRLVGLMHFELSAAQAVFAVWSAVLVIVSIMNYMETS